ncbi:MAG: hypothetical protein KGO92_07335 [Bacteroidota bacterium]|nr:hypothetical protein [Bacteroidota bacterium]
MKYMRNIPGLLVLFLISFTGYGQTLKGHWFGIGVIANTGDYNSYLSELVLQQNGNKIRGDLHYYFKDSLISVPVKGIYQPGTRRLHIDPFPMIYYRSSNAANSIDCMLSGDFMLIASKSSTLLNGSLRPDDQHKYTVPVISYRLTRSNDTATLVMQPELPETDTILSKTNVVISADRSTAKITQVESPVLTGKDSLPVVFTKRAKAFTKELEVVNTNLRLEIYDNGEIDYDSVTLYLNNKQILPKSMLTHRAIRLRIELDPNLEYNELSMFANNLGMIPPNTAALVLYDGETRYETLLSSDLSKSATLRIHRKK